MRLFFEKEFALFFPAVGDAATEFFQRQTDRLAVLPYRLYDVRREVRQLKRPGHKGAVHVQRLGDLPHGRCFAGDDLLHPLMSLDQRRLDRQTRPVGLFVSRVQFHLSGIPPQLAWDRQNALQVHAPGGDTEIRPGLFQQTGDSLGAEHDPNLILEDQYPVDERMDEFIALHGEHFAPESRDVLQRLSRLSGVEHISESAVADLRHHGRRL